MSADVTAGHLFAGIDGFGLGLEAVGIRTAWTCELDPFCDEVLALRLPGVERFRDVRELTGPPRVRFVTGGFPCQDLSNAGLGAGITGERSGLYRELVRVVADVQPDAVLIENVPALLHRGMELVVRDLVGLGYGVEWDCLPAAAFGAPHLRDRVWIVAHRASEPRVFGPPATLFALAPAGAAELVGGDDDEDEAPAGWMRWPRAGWVQGDPAIVTPLQPLAPLADVKRGRAFIPTPMCRKDGGSALDGGSNSRRAARRRGMWPTPLATDGDRGGRGDLLAVVKGRPNAHSGFIPTPIARDYKGAGLPGQLGTVAAEGRWPTPKAADGNGGCNEVGALARAGDPTARTLARPSGAKAALSLRTAVMARELWPTPRTGNSRGGGGETGTYRRIPSVADGTHGRHLQAEAVEAELDAGRIREEDVDAFRRQGGALNPAWVEWLMGFPIGWTDLAVATGELVAHPWEDGDPPGVPRIVERCDRRRERLSALGNALIPRAPAWIADRVLDLLEP